MISGAPAATHVDTDHRSFAPSIGKSCDYGSSKYQMLATGIGTDHFLYDTQYDMKTCVMDDLTRNCFDSRVHDTFELLWHSKTIP